MASKKEKSVDVKYLTSFALALRDMDDEVRHVQFSIVQEIESKELRAYFDVIDPAQVKLQEDALP